MWILLAIIVGMILILASLDDWPWGGDGTI